MLTRILLVIVSVVYIILLILKYAKKNGPKIEGTVRTIHGILQGQSRLNALYQREHDKRLSLCYTAFIT